MSATVEIVEDSVKKSSKKRKHEGDMKESKKKRKQVDEVVETNGTDELDSRSERKEKRKKDRASAAELQIETNSTSELTKPSKKDKKERKKMKESSEVSTETNTQMPGSQNDIELPDAPSIGEKSVIDGEDKNAAHGIAQQGDLEDQLQSSTPSSFHTKRMSLYLPIPPIGLDKALAAMLTLHVTPLLLTYFPPASGVILSVHDPVLSATPQTTLNQPLLPPYGSGGPKDPSHAFPKVGDEFGSCWAWLTVNFLVYSPQHGDGLAGWTNAMSEGFVGLVCYNYFQTSIAKSRIPKNWSWSGPTRETRQRKTPRKGKLNDGEGPSQESQYDSQETVVAREDDAIDGTAGTFLDEDGLKIPDCLQFRVVDLEMIPAQERGQLALQVEGTLLSEEEETRARQEEQERFETRTGKLRVRSRTPGTPVMSGGLATHSRAGSAMPRS
jgi:DNA-directed RNA polymerase I subunit RPA43